MTPVACPNLPAWLACTASCVRGARTPSRYPPPDVQPGPQQHVVQQGVACVALSVAPQQLPRARRQQVGVLAGAGETGTGKRGGGQRPPQRVNREPGRSESSWSVGLGAWGTDVACGNAAWVLQPARGVPSVKLGGLGAFAFGVPPGVLWQAVRRPCWEHVTLPQGRSGTVVPCGAQECRRLSLVHAHALAQAHPNTYPYPRPRPHLNHTCPRPLPYPQPPTAQIPSHSTSTTAPPPINQEPPSCTRQQHIAQYRTRHQLC